MSYYFDSMNIVFELGASDAFKRAKSSETHYMFTMAAARCPPRGLNDHTAGLHCTPTVCPWLKRLECMANTLGYNLSPAESLLHTAYSVYTRTPGRGLRVYPYPCPEGIQKAQHGFEGQGFGWLGLDSNEYCSSTKDSELIASTQAWQITANGLL